MSPPSDQNEMPPHIREVLERTRKEAERLREIYGDPEETVSAFIREHFTREALEEVFQEMVQGASVWNDDDKEWALWRNSRYERGFRNP